MTTPDIDMPDLEQAERELEQCWRESDTLIPNLTPEEIEAHEAFMAPLRAALGFCEGHPRRKPENPNHGPSKRVCIRIPRPLLDLLKEQAERAGMKYQTYINAMLYEGVTR